MTALHIEHRPFPGHVPAPDTAKTDEWGYSDQATDPERRRRHPTCEPSEVPGSPDPAFQRPLNPPELVAQ